MKRIVFVCYLLLGLLPWANTFAQGIPEKVAGQEDGPVMSLDKEVHDFGKIAYGSEGVCYFTVTNNGNAPLIIAECKKSCGCTTPECSSEPIPPGGSRRIAIKYDTKRPGAFEKSVTITSNAANTPTRVIRIKGDVAAKPEGDMPANKVGPVEN